MNNKGFIFAETLATTLVIMILLISFYVFSTNFIDNQSKNKNYDNIEEIYKLANIRLYLYKNVRFNDIFNSKDETGQTCISLNRISIDDVEDEKYQYLLSNEFGIKQIYMCEFGTESYNFTDSFASYFEYVEENFKDKYRIIAHFNNDKFASIKVWQVNYNG